MDLLFTLKTRLYLYMSCLYILHMPQKQTNKQKTTRFEWKLGKQNRSEATKCKQASVRQITPRSKVRAVVRGHHNGRKVRKVRHRWQRCTAAPRHICRIETQHGATVADRSERKILTPPTTMMMTSQGMKRYCLVRHP